MHLNPNIITLSYATIIERGMDEIHVLEKEEILGRCKELKKKQIFHKYK
jgi:hypothetical protein